LTLVYLTDIMRIVSAGTQNVDLTVQWLQPSRSRS